MMGSLLGAVVVVGLICYVLARIGQWARSTWVLVRLWRWLSGEAHHGRPVTDAGWIRPGRKALTPTGHATRWWHRPRWQRAAHRTGGTFAAVVLVTAYLANPTVTSVFVIFAVLVAAGAGSWLVWRRLRQRKHRGTWLLPLHYKLHPIAGVPRAALASSWLEVETDVGGAVRMVRITLPSHFQAEVKERDRLVAIASATVGLESPKVEPMLLGAAPTITLIRSEPPPPYVGFDTLLGELPKLRPDELLLGVGKEGQLVKASLGTDSPHLSVSMGTGAGKSNLAGWILFQLLMRGWVGLVFDAKKGNSYPWVLKDMDKEFAQLPCVGFARTVAELHEGMSWLSDELDRRGEVAITGMDARGKVHANVGTPMFIVAEELNMAEGDLRAYWAMLRSQDDPARSPAFTGLGKVTFGGRYVRMHEILIGQMLTASVTGYPNSSVKENCGIKMLARYGQKGWRVMCDDVPMPPSPEHTGRIQVVTGRRVRECQVPELDPERARQMILDSDMASLPSTMPRCLMRHVANVPALVGAPPPPAAETVSPAPEVTPPMPLRAIVDSGFLSAGTTLAAVKMWRFRDREAFPQPAGKRGRDFLYHPAEVAEYDEARR